MTLAEDVALILTDEVIRVFILVIDEDEAMQARTVVYQAAKAAIDIYEEKRKVRLTPSEN